VAYIHLHFFSKSKYLLIKYKNKKIVEKIGIIGAMDEEVEKYLSELTDTIKLKASGMIFYSGKFHSKDIVIVKSGVGKVNAAICTQILIDKFGISKIIFTGVAGAINPGYEIMDIIISIDCIQYDMDARGLGFEKGRIPFTDLKIFMASEELRRIAIACSQIINEKVIEGRMLTGDQFLIDINATKLIREEFQGDCVDMESAAIAQVCTLNKIPFLIIRTISDKADHSATVNFSEFCKKSADLSYKLVNEIIKNIDG
jgi:adenosylhomocysteine nucleosidase